jgi:hypothetical protein
MPVKSLELTRVCRSGNDLIETFVEKPPNIGTDYDALIDQYHDPASS